MNINIVDARGLFTKMLIEVYDERPQVFSFLRSFFPSKTSASKQLSIQVRRGTELVAVDVLRGTQGNRNEMSRSTEKIIIPPYYREWFNATDLDFYDRLFGSDSGGTVDEFTFSEWLETVSEKLGMLQDKIERSYERQASEVLQTGVVQLQSAVNIDFRRKAGSLVDLGATNYWDDTGVNPVVSITAGVRFLRTIGKSQGASLNMILGGDAFNALVDNPSFKDRLDIRRVDLGSVREPQRNAVGGNLVGSINVESHRILIWTYGEYYDTAAAANNPYIAQNNMILLPEAPRFTLGFAAVPHIFRDPRNAEFPEFIVQTRGAFMIGNYIDPKAEAHVFDIKSAGIAIPVAVDQIYTAQVLA